MKKRKTGFTLIELIATLVIISILALIVTPIVMSIIKKARISSDKRSIDAYGSSIELAITGYLMDNGTFPTSIDQLTIEYTGPEVVCSTTQLNNDSSVYLTGCTVGGRSVEGYTYGKGGGEVPTPTYTAYSVGDEVSYNNVDYYVIADSGVNESTVTLLKAEPLTVAEVNQYGGVGTANNHVNMYNTSSSESHYRTAYNNNGYGGMAYYTSVDCGYGQDSNYTYSGCTIDYEQSEVKYVVDAWKNDKAPAALTARLITIDDLEDNLGYEQDPSVTTQKIPTSTNTPTWVYNGNYYYWTGSQYEDSTDYVWSVYSSGIVGKSGVGDSDGSDVVRPVITISKTNISS